MQYHFSENRFIQKIDTVQEKKKHVNEWNSFSSAPVVSESVSETGALYGKLNQELDAMEISL